MTRLPFQEGLRAASRIGVVNILWWYFLCFVSKIGDLLLTQSELTVTEWLRLVVAGDAMDPPEGMLLTRPKWDETSAKFDLLKEITDGGFLWSY